jgi:uroporphyrinogen-III synthase
MDKPLQNRKIVVTRDKHQAVELIKSLKSFGAECLLLPAIKISETDDWHDCDLALQEINTYDWIVFSSANGIRFFYKRAEELKAGNYKNKIAVVGKKTLRELEEYGLKADLIPATFSASGLIEAFRSENIRGKRILNPTSEIARDTLQSGLEEFGAQVDRITVYKNECVKGQYSNKVIEAIGQNIIDAILFFSPSAFNCFIQSIGPAACNNLKKSKAVIAAIGSTTAAAIEDRGFRVDIIPQKGIQEFLVKAVVEYFLNKS